MARESSVTIGSGLKPGINTLPVRSDGLKHLTGTNVVVLNHEDASASGPISITQIAVSGIAVALPSFGLEFRRSLTIRNFGSGTIFLGNDNSVAINNGFPLQTLETLSLEITGNIPIFGITDGTSQDVRIIEIA